VSTVAAPLCSGPLAGRTELLIWQNEPKFGKTLGREGDRTLLTSLRRSSVDLIYEFPPASKALVSEKFAERLTALTA
jgi:hypothetical protein